MLAPCESHFHNPWRFHDFNIWKIIGLRCYLILHFIHVYIYIYLFTVNIHILWKVIRFLGSLHCLQIYRYKYRYNIDMEKDRDIDIGQQIETWSPTNWTKVGEPGETPYRTQSGSTTKGGGGEWTNQPPLRAKLNPPEIWPATLSESTSHPLKLHPPENFTWL